MTALIADIGGTNTRCAITGAGGPERIVRYRNAEYPGIGALLADYLATMPADTRSASAILAVAAPVRGSHVQMTNLGWSFEVDALRDELELDSLQVLNDFEAQAYALPALLPDECLQIGAGQTQAGAPKGVLGPGTGLGVATLLPVGDDWLAVPGEGGHVTMGASDAHEADLIRAVRERFGHCSAERLISGPGLALVHEILHDEAELAPEEIGRRMETGDTAAMESFDTCCKLLGTVAANLALTVGAFGGIYIAGGILPQHTERFAASGFRPRFEAKGRYGDYLKSIPTYLVTADEPALQGLWARASRAA